MDSYRLMGWVIPILCMGGACFVGLKQNATLQETQSQRAMALQEVVNARAVKAAIDAQGEVRRYAAADWTEAEQTAFLTDLREWVKQSGAVIKSWSTSVGEYGPRDTWNQGLKAYSTPELDLLKGVTRISCTVSLTGSYGAIRSLLDDLSNSDRLFTLSKVTWSRSKDGTNLVVTVSRYVMPPASKLRPEAPDLPRETS